MCFDARKFLRGGLALLALAAGCGGAPTGLTITVMAGSDVARPTALSVSWLSDRGTLYQREEIPVGSGDKLASIFIELDRSDTSDRRILVRGTGPGTARSIGAARIRDAAGSPTLVVTLQAKLADMDGDGLPDVIDDCTDCVTGDAGAPPEDALVDPYPDGSDPSEPDAEIAIDLGASLEPDAGMASDTAPPTDASAPPPVSAGLMGLWRMDEGAGTVVGDSSPTANAGTIMRPTASDWGPGRAGTTALNLSGTSWLSVPSSRSYDATGGLTLSAWVFWTKATPAGQVIMARQRGTGLQNSFWLGLENNRLHFSVEDEGVNVAMVAGRWVHVTGTYDGSKVAVFLDGSLVIAAAVAAKPLPTNRGVSIGADVNGSDPAAGTSMFLGRIEDVGIFDRALTAAEVAKLAK